MDTNNGNDSANETINNSNNVVNNDSIQDKKPGLGSKLSSGLREINGLRNDYNQAGGLSGLAKNAIKNKIGDKINDKVDGAKQNIKNKASSMVPDSIKQKQQALKNKQQALNEKLHAPQKKIEEGKAKLNEQTFKKGVKAAANAIAPGTGEVAEKMLDTSKGKPAVEAARAASNPLSALKEGTKKLMEIVISKEIKKKLAMYLIPTGVILFIIIVIVLGIVSKFTDSQTFFKGEAYSGENIGSAISEEYEKFYENVETYGGSNKAMVIAVLTAYKDNDAYGANGDYDSDCTDEEISRGFCSTIATSDIVLSTSKRKMKRYIKKVANEIEKSGYDVTEGDYTDPENTGSKFFQWLYKEFIADYYDEYLKNLSGDKLAEKKEEIIHFIYLYYKDIQEGNNMGSFISSSCPNGITVTGNDAGTYDLEEYVAGVVAHENYYSVDGNIEAMKAQAIAARTYALKTTKNCTKPIENSQNAQTFYSPQQVSSTYPEAKRAAEETKGQVLIADGDLILAQYDGFYGTCSGDACTATYKKIPSEEQHTFTVPIKYIPSYARNYFGHGRGMSQYGSRWLQDSEGYTFDKILGYFYSSNVSISTMTAATVGDLYAFGGSGIMGESLYPISKVDINRTYKSAGWYYPGGKYHGAVDIACSAGDSSCHTIGIYSAHDGVVSSINKSQCNSYSSSAASKTGLSYNPSCPGGTYIGVKITSGTYTGYTFYYYHLSSIVDTWKIGDTVTAGQLLGYMGNTGNSSGPHLHFQLSDKEGNRVNFNSSVDQLLSNIK